MTPEGVTAFINLFRPCVVCATPLAPEKRADAKYCSQRCVRRAWKARNPHRPREYRQSILDNPDRHAANKRRNRATKYGITPEQLDDILAKPCGICGQPSTDVDHDHRCCPAHTSCGACIRGGLCRRCNLGSGYIDGWTDKELERVLAWTKRG